MGTSRGRNGNWKIWNIIISNFFSSSVMWGYLYREKYWGISTVVLVLLLAPWAPQQFITVQNWTRALIKRPTLSGECMRGEEYSLGCMNHQEKQKWVTTGGVDTCPPIWPFDNSSRKNLKHRAKSFGRKNKKIKSDELRFPRVGWATSARGVGHVLARGHVSLS